MKDICNNFPITSDEYNELDEKFGKLCYYAAHQLKKKNTKNNCVEDIDDINQELQLSIIRAGSYYKRQIYIENCLVLVKKHAKKTDKNKKLIRTLQNLWNNRTRHGANRQKFGPIQEKLLEDLVVKYVPRKNRPSRTQSLRIDSKFSTYCKAIVWNGQKSMGKKITREKTIRSGLVSLSEYDYLGANL